MVTNAVKRWRGTPAQKSVLMCLADVANDDGEWTTSIAHIEEWTCLGRTAVIEAVKALEAIGLICVQRSAGRPSRVTVLFRQLAAGENQSGKRSSPGCELVRQVNPHPSGSRTPTSPGGEPPPSVSRMGPVRETDPIHQDTISHQHTRERVSDGDPPMNAGPKPSPAAAVCIAMRNAGLQDANPSHPVLLELVAKGLPVDAFVAAADKAVKQGKGLAFALGIVRNQAAEAAIVRATPMAVAPLAAGSTTVPSRPSRDPALVQIEQDGQRAVPPPAAEREKWQSMLRSRTSQATATTLVADQRRIG